MGKLLAALGLAAVVASCGGGGGAGSPDMTIIGCTTDKRAETYAPGMSQLGQSKLWTFTLVTALPAPPAKGNNSWTLDITDSAGKPVTGVHFKIRPWMPDHGHGTSVVPTITPSGTGYVISPLYLFMPGLWQVTIDATAPATSAADASPDAGATQSDSTVFSFCIQG